MNLKFKYEGTDDFTGIDANTQLLVLRLSPFSGAFQLTAGPAFLDWTGNGAKTGEVAGSGVTAQISWKTTFPSTGLLYALGWNQITDFGVSGGIGFGRIAAEPPSVEIEITKIPVRGKKLVTQILKNIDNILSMLAEL